jgi:hypothetical protein
MKRSAVIFLLVIYVFSSTELSEMLKMPTLIEHLSEHQTQNKSISFFDFISLHYIDGNGHGAEDAHDRSLPFKSHDHCQAVASMVAELPEDQYQLSPISSPIQKSVPIHEESPYFSYSSLIWQPPKSA